VVLIRHFVGSEDPNVEIASPVMRTGSSLAQAREVRHSLGSGKFRGQTKCLGHVASINSSENENRF